MIKVANKKIIRKLSLRSFHSNKMRNIFAILAIALTAILFTTIFTVAITINYSWQQQTLHMFGSNAHGSFIKLSEEQVNQLKKHPLIKEYGTSMMLGIITEGPFSDSPVRMCYGDDNSAKMCFSYPTVGHMPKDKMELVTDTAVLDLFGIPHQIGQKVTLSYTLGDKKVTDTFTLSGYWETEEGTSSNLIWLSKPYIKEKLTNNALTGSEVNKIKAWELDMMFENSKNIEQNIRSVAEDSGYNVMDITASNYVKVAVNYAYISNQLNSSDKIMTMLAIFIGILLTILTGYFIIFNIFQISISNDIRFYGLLKTIGTTKKQIKLIIKYQALLLSLIGIPFGLIIGYIIGTNLTETILSSMNNISTYKTTNPWIFIGSALFCYCTVIISCHKPQKIAASVSPIEAIRYAEKYNGKKKVSKTKNGSKVYQMAVASIKRNRKKTIFVIISLSLSLTLLNVSYSIAKGIDMDKFLDKFLVTDFIVGHDDYFNSNFNNEDQKVSETLISKINACDGIEQTGRVYNYTDLSYINQNKERYIQYESYWLPPEEIEPGIVNMKENETIPMPVDLYGLEDFPMGKLTLVEGKIDHKQLNNSHSVLQVVVDDDFGNPAMQQAIYDVGDTVTIHYCTDYTRDEQGNVTENNGFDIDYEVVGTVTMPNAMSLRRYGSLQLVMAADIMKQDLKNSCSTMNYMVDADTEHTAEIDNFIKEYTTKNEPKMAYESKLTNTKYLKTYIDMLLLVGGVLSFIIGLIGVLNFINVVITSIMTRRRELAMLQSIGMTGKQVKKMLIIEGTFYGYTSSLVAILVSCVIDFLLLKPLEETMWLFTFRFTVMPILYIFPIFLFLGIVIPLITYAMVNNQSIVERLREVE